MKHIDTVFLWVQATITEGEVTLGKNPTKEMLADFLTKHVDAATMLNCMTGFGDEVPVRREHADLKSANWEFDKSMMSSLLNNSEMICSALWEHVIQI